MEHSKLPWTKHNNYIKNSDGIFLCCVSSHLSRPVDVANSEFIVTACNEHDTLKAKAELFELMKKQMDELLGTVGDSLTNGMYHKCNNTLRIAKEIK